MDTKAETDFKTIVESARAEQGAAVVDVFGEIDLADIDGMPITGVPMLVTRKTDGSQQAMSVLSEVEAWRARYATRPLRREGTIAAHDLATFVAATNRDKRQDSVIFADAGARKVAAILDFHGRADKDPRFCKDRVTYEFKTSPQLDAWTKASGQPMTQKEFARLIDDRLGDLGDGGDVVLGSIADEFASRRGVKFASVTDMLVFTRSIATKSTSDHEEIRDAATGSVSLQYSKKNDIKTKDGSPVAVPAAFLLRLPMLNGIGATQYNIAVRLKFDIEDGEIAWRIELHAIDQYMIDAIDKALDVVRGPVAVPAEWKPAKDGDVYAPGCGLPVYLAQIP